MYILNFMCIISQGLTLFSGFVSSNLLNKSCCWEGKVLQVKNCVQSIVKICIFQSFCGLFSLADRHATGSKDLASLLPASSNHIASTNGGHAGTEARDASALPAGTAECATKSLLFIALDEQGQAHAGHCAANWVKHHLCMSTDEMSEKIFKRQLTII